MNPDLTQDEPSYKALYTELKGERDALHLAICGGEDAPGYAASLSHEMILRVLADNYASARRDSELAWDGETANTWKARAAGAEMMRDVYRDIAIKLGACPKCAGLHGPGPCAPSNPSGPPPHKMMG